MSDFSLDPSTGQNESCNVQTMQQYSQSFHQFDNQPSDMTMGKSVGWETTNHGEVPRKIGADHFTGSIQPQGQNGSTGNSNCTSSTDGESESSEDDQKPWDSPSELSSNRKRACDEQIQSGSPVEDTPAEKIPKTEESDLKAEFDQTFDCDSIAIGREETISEAPIDEEKLDLTPKQEDSSVSPSSDSFSSSRDHSPNNQDDNGTAELTLVQEQDKSSQENEPKQKRKYVRKSEQERQLMKKRLPKKDVDDDDDDDDERKKVRVKGPKIPVKDKFRENSSQWAFYQKVLFGKLWFDSLGKDKFTDKQHEKVRKFLEDHKEKKIPLYLSAPITLDTIFMDQGNYRHCLQYLMNATIRTIPAPQKKKGGRQVKTPTVAPHYRLTGPLFLPFTCTGDEVIEAASQWITSHTNAVYFVEKLDPPRPDPKLLMLEREMYKEQMQGLNNSDRNRFPVPNLHVKTKEEVFDHKFERILNSASITNVTGIAAALGIDTDLFSLSTIAKTHPNLSVDVLHQCPQTANTNCNVEGEQGWETTGYKTLSNLTEYSKYIKEEKKKGRRAYEELANAKTKNMNQVSACLRAEFMENQTLPEECDKSMQWHKFGTNIDIVSKRFDKQLKELTKLPEFLQPKQKGNLLNYTGCKVLGINTVQMYAKPPGARTPAHMENSLMASINWNRGPGVCVWFAVPYEYWGVLEDMVAERGQAYHMQNYWPNETELIDAGIPVIKFEQKADEMVYVNTGCFHWVQSNGFCVNVSWNVGQPTFTQLATSMVSYSHNIITGFMSHIPLVNAIWNVARKKMFVDDDLMYKAVKSVLIRTLAHTKWYSDVIRHNGFEVEDASKRTDFDRVQRCNYCGSEIYNIVRWFMSDDQTAPQYTFCANCKVPKQYSDGRKEKFTIFDDVETLKKIFDGYVRG